MNGLQLPDRHDQHWQDALPVLIQKLQPGAISLDCGEWPLSCGELMHLSKTLAVMGCTLQEVCTANPETFVSAAALGISARPHIGPISPEQPCPETTTTANELLFHRGTLRSGDHLQTEGDVLLFGDVNPGAQLSADGDVLVWGRLRGTAHAGRCGRTSARIVALQLRPLQLRIADVVARGPEEQPQTGLAEQARLHDGEILIEPAPAQAMVGR